MDIGIVQPPPDGIGAPDNSSTTEFIEKKKETCNPFSTYIRLIQYEAHSASRNAIRGKSC